MKRAFALTILLAAVVVGCGGQATEERLHEQRDHQLEQWSNQEGPMWKAYATGYDSGWSDGCFETLLELGKGTTLAALCAGPGPGPQDSFDVPTYPPDYPRYEGRQAGFDAGCSDIYNQLLDRSPPLRFCERLRLSS